MFFVQNIQVHTSTLKGLPIPASPSFSVIFVPGRLFFSLVLQCASLILPFFLLQVPALAADFMTLSTGLELADPLPPSAVLLRRITLPTLLSSLRIPMSSWPDDFLLLSGRKLVPVSRSLLGVLGMDR